jgi:hypothetical protein
MSAQYARMLFWNVDGLLCKREGFQHFLNSQKIDNALKSENHLTQDTSYNFF